MSKKLSLHKETVKQLNLEQSQRIEGGALPISKIVSCIQGCPSNWGLCSLKCY